MATYQRNKNSDGTTSFVAQVRIKPFKPIAKSFPTKLGAKEWAQAKERELREQRKHGADRADLPSLTVKTLVDEFLADSETKALRYYDDLERLCAWWVNELGASKVGDIGVLKLRAARDRLKGSGSEARVAATVNRYLSAFRSCWNWGRTAGLVPQERGWPTRLMLTEPKGRTRFLTDAELARLLVLAQNHSQLMYTAVIVSIATGVRQGELLRLKWADIDLDAGKLTLLLTKNDDARSVFIPSIAIDALRTLRSAKVVSPTTVFLADAGTALNKSMLEARWNKIRKEAGLANFRWHDLRHTCASFLAQKGATLLEIGSVLGHRSPAVTQRYSHLVQGAPVTGHTGLDAKLRGSHEPSRSQG
jgi:integrase